MAYCTEFIVMLEETWSDEKEQDFKSYLSGIGDCVVVVGDEDIVKVHVHTNHPGKAIEKGLTYGELTSMKIDNMREEHQERLHLTRETSGTKEMAGKKKESRKPYGFIAVSIGDGLNQIFRDLGVDCLIEGGQTMNPSTEDLLEAVDQVSADTIFILPNIRILFWLQIRQSLLWKISKLSLFLRRQFHREFLRLLGLNRSRMWRQMWKT